jgi:hypothetical protein
MRRHAFSQMFTDAYEERATSVFWYQTTRLTSQEEVIFIVVPVRTSNLIWELTLFETISAIFTVKGMNSL